MNALEELFNYCGCGNPEPTSDLKATSHNKKED